MKRILISSTLYLFVILTLAQPYSGETFKKWGDECYAATEKYLRVAGVYSYEETRRGHQSRATCWPLGVQLKALIWGGYIEQAEYTYAYFHNNYFRRYNGIDGYDAVYRNPHADRYYDDNAWIAKVLMDLYHAVDNPQKKELYLDRAKMTIAFCMSGESVVGGLHWHESESNPNSELYNSWSVISTAPTAVANLKVYQVTNEEKYLYDGTRLYEFIKEQGFHGIGGGFRGYENAVVMQAALLLHQITGEQTYLDDVYQMAYSMESIYISWNDHVLHEVGKWGGHDMTDAYVDLYNFDKNPRWLGIVAGYLVHIHDYIKDENNFYPENWDDQMWKTQPMVNGSRIYGLNEEASAMSAFYRLAATPVDGIKEKEPVALFKHRSYNRVTDGQPDENGTEVGIEGWAIGLFPGRYTSEDLRKRGMCNNLFKLEKELSSIIIAEGYKVTIYSKDNFTGVSKSYTESTPYLGATWDNRAASIIIEKIGESSNNKVVNNNPAPAIYATYFSKEIQINNMIGHSYVDLFDYYGKQHISLSTTDSSISLPATDLPVGIYILKINANNNIHIKKIVKQ